MLRLIWLDDQIVALFFYHIENIDDQMVLKFRIYINNQIEMQRENSENFNSNPIQLKEEIRGQYQSEAKVQEIQERCLERMQRNQGQVINYQSLYEEEKKKVLDLTKQLELEKIKVNKMRGSTKIKGKLCPKCLEQNQKNTSHSNKLIDDLKGFSIHIPESKKSNKSKHSFQKVPSLKKEILNTVEGSNKLSMFENFTIFGIRDESIRDFENEDLEPQLLYSLRKSSEVENQACSFVFPSGAAIKKLSSQKAKDKAIEIMSYCYTNLKSFILRFKCQENIDEKDYNKNKFLMHINPERQLFFLCIGINDYTSVDKKGREEEGNLSLNGSQKESNEDNFAQQLSSKTISSTSSNKSVDAIISQRVFCITSYYPFFTFYEEILRNLINIVKMERLMIYKHNNEDIKASDSQFQLTRMKELFAGSLETMNNKVIQFNRSYQLKLINHQKITLLTDWNLAKNYFADEWIFSIFNMFNLDSFIDLFTLLMLEDKLVFVCDNSHILTYTIYLFTSLLTKPFKYEFEIVNILPEEDFLSAPFPFVFGMLKKRKYIEESRIMERYENTYIFLSPEKVDIIIPEIKDENQKKTAKLLLKVKPTKLKNELSGIFKDMRKMKKISPKSTKYEIQIPQYALSSSVEERQIAIRVVQKVNEYLMQQIVNKLPNEIQIQKMKNSIDPQSLPEDKDGSSYLIEQIIQIFRKLNKDPFADKFIETQIMSEYLLKQ